MPVWLRVALILAVPYFGWDFLMILDDSHHWFWTISRPHYEISFSIETPDGAVHAGKGVVEPVYFAPPSWEHLLPPIPEFGGPGLPVFGRFLNGEAVTLGLPDGKVICMLLNEQFDSIENPKRHYRIFEIADRLLTTDEKIPFLRFGREPFIEAHTAALVSGSAEIPIDLLPSMVVFLDGANPHSAHVFDPANPEKWLGPGAKFLGATITVTKAPIQSDLQKFVPWLRDPKPLGDMDFWLHGTTPQDPFADEIRDGRYTLTH
jgi:hypothetical protein